MKKSEIGGTFSKHETHDKYLHNFSWEKFRAEAICKAYV
jgi:hypothetical protein